MNDMEAEVCDAMGRFQRDYMGLPPLSRSPSPPNIRCHLIGEVLLVRMRDVRSAAEAHLVATMPGGKGRDLLKEVHTHLIESARPRLDAMIAETTGQKVVSVHHDLSTRTGEEVMVFTLGGVPQADMPAAEPRRMVPRRKKADATSQ